MHRYDPLKLVKFCDDSRKISTKPTYPKIFIFLKTPKNIEIQNFDPPNGPSLRMYANENIREPTAPIVFVQGYS